MSIDYLDSTKFSYIVYVRNVSYLQLLQVKFAEGKGNGASQMKQGCVNT